MESEKHPIDELFRRALSGYEVSPPADTWYSIEHSLDRKSQVRRITFVWAAAASVAIFFAFAGGYFLAAKKAVNNNTMVASQKAVKENPQVLSAGSQLSSSDLQAPVEINSSGTIPVKTQVSALTHIDNLNPVTDAFSVQQAIIEPKSPAPDEQGTMLYAIRSIEAHAVTGRISTPVELGIPDNKPSFISPGADEFVVLDGNETNNNQQERTHKWSLGGQVSPLYAYRDVQTSSQQQSYSSGGVRTPNSLALNKNESPMLSYAGGLNVQYAASKRLKVMSGLYYARMGQNLTGTVYNATGIKDISYTDVNTNVMSNSNGSISVESSTGTIDNTSQTPDKMSNGNTAIDPAKIPTVNLAQQFDYLEVPLILKYRILDKRFGVNLIGGVATDFMVGNQVIAQKDGKNKYIDNTGGVRTTNYSSHVGIGFDYAITELIRISLEPGFRYYLASVNTNRNVDVHPYAFGVYTGFSFAF